MSPVEVSTRPQRFARARLPGPHLTHLVRLFLIAHHDGLQPTQHEAVWGHPPPGDPEGPILHPPRSTASEELPTTSLLHAQDTRDHFNAWATLNPGVSLVTTKAVIPWVSPTD